MEQKKGKLGKFFKKAIFVTSLTVMTGLLASPFYLAHRANEQIKSERQFTFKITTDLLNGYNQSGHLRGEALENRCKKICYDFVEHYGGKFSEEYSDIDWKTYNEKMSHVGVNLESNLSIRPYLQKKDITNSL